MQLALEALSATPAEGWMIKDLFGAFTVFHYVTNVPLSKLVSLDLLNDDLFELLIGSLLKFQRLSQLLYQLTSMLCLLFRLLCDLIRVLCDFQVIFKRRLEVIFFQFRSQTAQLLVRQAEALLTNHLVEED